MNPTPEHDDEDVDVNTSEGLVTFSMYVSEVWNEIIASYQSGTLDVSLRREAEVIYNDLFTLIAHCREVKSQGALLEDDDIDALQVGYNYLLDIADHTAVTSPDIHKASIVENLESAPLDSSDVSTSIRTPLPMIPNPTVPMVRTPAPTPMVQPPQIHHGPLSSGDSESKRRTSVGPFSEIVEDLSHISRYRTHIESNYSSRTHFESLLKREVDRIEEKPLRGFYKVFGFQYANAFYTLLKDMTIPETVAFDDQPRVYIREILKESDIKYEVYVEWIDRLVEMLERTHAHKDMTVGELFVRNFLEEKIAQELAKSNVVS